MATKGFCIHYIDNKIQTQIHYIFLFGLLTQFDIKVYD